MNCWGIWIISHFYCLYQRCYSRKFHRWGPMDPRCAS